MCFCVCVCVCVRAWILRMVLPLPQTMKAEHLRLPLSFHTRMWESLVEYIYFLISNLPTLYMSRLVSFLKLLYASASAVQHDDWSLVYINSPTLELTVSIIPEEINLYAHPFTGRAFFRGISFLFVGLLIGIILSFDIVIMGIAMGAGVALALLGASENGWCRTGGWWGRTGRQLGRSHPSLKVVR